MIHSFSTPKNETTEAADPILIKASEDSTLKKSSVKNVSNAKRKKHIRQPVLAVVNDYEEEEEEEEEEEQEEEKNRIEMTIVKSDDERQRSELTKRSSIELPDEKKQIENMMGSALDCENEHAEEVENDCVEETGSFFSDRDEKEEAETLPWHHVQLYHLLGKEADYFLFPKLDLEKRVVKPLSITLKSKIEHSSADGVWSALRKESNRKLVQIDNRLPRELKNAYRAFIRDYMKGKDPEDTELLASAAVEVPEIAELMNDLESKKTLARRQKMQIMFRSSRRNEDRMNVLIHNNPIPDLNNMNGDDSIVRFLMPRMEMNLEVFDPSDLHNSTDDVVKQSTKALKDKDLDDDDDDAFIFEDLDEMQYKPRPAKCVFLTESDTVTPGAFSRKRRDLIDAVVADTRYNKSNIERQNVSVIPSSLRGPDRSSGDMKAGNKGKKHKTKEPSEPWQPLTVGALMEYATKYSAPGQGSFKYGGQPMWSVHSVK